MRELPLLTCLTLFGLTAAAEAATVADVVKLLQEGKQTVRIVCFGDSITGVYYHTGSQRAWTDMLGLALQQIYPKAKLEMINAGISGHTTVNALARIDKDVIAKKPHLVVVMFGMNDIARVKPEDYQQNLKTICEKCAATDAAVMLCTPNSVYENGARPNSGLLGLAKRVQHVGAELNWPVVDCFAAWQDLREKDETAWMLLMSDAIHPNMHGHIKFAELISGKIAGKTVALKDVAPPDDALPVTIARLKAGQPIKLVAMSPYDKLIPAVLHSHYPSAKFEVTEWPVAGKSLAELRTWGKRVRSMKPHLVVVSVPASITGKTTGETIRDFEWVLNWSFAFGKRSWDVLPILPNVSTPVADSELETLMLYRKLIQGKDVQYLQRASDDKRSVEKLLDTWISAHKQ